AFGVEVVRRLLSLPSPEGVDIVDFGIRGIDLAFAMESRRYETVILVDACPRGKAPGTLFVLEPCREVKSLPVQLIDPHNLDPARVLAWAAQSGDRMPRLRVVGCEPSPLGSPEEMCGGLSAAVAAAIGPAVELVGDLISEARCTSL